MDSAATSLIVNLLLTIPQALIIGVGLVLSLVLRKRLGNRSLFTLLGFVAMLLAAIAAVVTSALTAFMPSIAADNHMSYGQISAYLGITGAVRTLFELVGWALLLVGIFKKTGDAPATPKPAFTPAQPGFGAQPGTPAQPGFGTPQGFPAQPAGQAPAPGQAPAAGQPAAPVQPAQPGFPGAAQPGGPTQPGYGAQPGQAQPGQTQPGQPGVPGQQYPNQNPQY
ncbi:hypothetical protein [Actinocatenispora rupis]|uniref:Uncharacterized protein n=1 Tax=Actinocatenispora rupis TaxID=519421 RepID=A0A8J3NDS8_9ACTN|nr:hypothetical protein [Actinocatenispora rupis]GID13267.1 hypothetical protein Aru02nite_41560 [Actinocatenispora rupis]